MNIFTHSLLLFSILCFFFNPFFSKKVYAQSASCATATVLTAGAAGAACVNTTGSLGGFTNTTRCGVTSREGFYQFQATNTSHTITIVGNSNFDAILSVGTACATPTNLANCIDTGGNAGTETATLTGLTIGNFYFIAVRNFNSPGGNNANNNGFNICVTTPLTAPTNDICGSAISLTQQASGACTITSGSISGATQSLTPCVGSGSGFDVWYSFIAVGTTAIVRRNANFDSVVEVFSGGCGGLVSLVCQDNEGDINLSGLTNGNTYRVRIFYYSSGYPTNPTFTLCVTTPLPPPANNDCTGATTLTHQTFGNCVRSSGTVTNATQSLAGCSGTATLDIWFRFVATSTVADVRIDWAENSSVIQIFSSSNNLCTGTLTSLVCESINANAVATSLTIGNTYFVRVYPSFGSTTRPDFAICVTTTSTATNNLCPSPTTITHQGANNCTQIAGTFTGTTQSLADCAGVLTTANDVWYSFTATNTSALIHRVATFDTNLQVFTATSTCAALTSVSCHTLTADLQVTGLTIGSTYLLRIYPDSNTLPSDPRFSICVSTPATITNQTCANAAPICGTNNYSFQAITGGTAPAGNNYGCLSTQPAPAWFYFQVATSGDIIFGLESSDDVDFAVWGPYTSFTTATANCGNLPAPVSCSYSIYNVENPAVPNAIVGQVYVMLITNFANINQVVNLRKIGGSGGTACSIVLGNPLVMFNGENKKQNNVLKWTINENQEMAYFEILKSQNGKDFQVIGKMDATTKPNTQEYVFNDLQTNCGTSFYKIRNFQKGNEQKDVIMTESNIIQLIRQEEMCDNIIKVYPNPCTDLLNVFIDAPENTELAYKIHDISGKILQNGIVTLKDKKSEIAVSHLPKGMFVFETFINGKIQRQKIVKN